MLENTANPTGDASPPLPVLSEEIIWQILLRVPVRFLLRFRCVSKSWKTLISHPQFVKDHLRVSTTDSNITHQLLASSSMFGVSHKIASFPLQPLFQNPSTPYQVRHFEINGEYIIGSCNGLLCITDHHAEYVTLWNPSMNLIYKRLLLGYDAFFGFGYDHINDKYKLLGVTGTLDKTVTRIYTFGVDSWTVIPNLRRDPIQWLGKFVNGNLNWVAERYPSDDKWLIISFNLATETYGEMVLCDGYTEQVFVPSLSVLHNCLCLSSYDTENSHWVVWLMKEYGVEDSWTKLMVIPWPSYAEVSCIISENVVLLFNFVTSKLCLYNSHDGRLTNLEIRGSRWRDSQIYHESLVPLPC